MQPPLSLACFLSVIRPPGVQFEDALLQILPVDKAKCPFVREKNDIGFRLFTRHNPTVPQELRIDDDEALFASNFDFHSPTVFYFGAFMEQPDDGSGLMVRESYMLRGQTNFVILDISRLEAGPWYFSAAENTWYIGNFAAKFIDYMVSRGMSLNTTHLVGHSLGGQSAGVTGYAIKSGKVSRITALDPALPLFAHLPLAQRLDPSDGEFVDVIHTDAGIFGYKTPIGHVDFYPNGGISPQPGCELEVVLHEQRLLNKCEGPIELQGYYIYTLTPNKKQRTLASKLLEFFTYINSLNGMNTPAMTETAINFKGEPNENFRKSSPKLAAEKKTKLAKHNNEKKTLISHKSTHTTDLTHGKTDYKDGIPINEDITHTTDRTFIQEVSGTKDNFNQEVVKDISTNTSYKREKRTSIEIQEAYTKDNATIKNTETNTYIDELTSNNKPHSDEITVKQPNIEETVKHENNLNITTIVNANMNENTQPQKINKKSRHLQFKLTNLTPLLRIASTLHSKDKQEAKIQKTIKHRQRRFINLFKNNNENDNFLFKMLEFLVKNRKNVIPVVTVMREINTLVKSANGELNHFSKEKNNYIGAIPTLTPIKYDLELGETGIVSFVKKLLGLTPRGGKLTITK